MNIDELTIGQARQIAGLLHSAHTPQSCNTSHPWEVGLCYFIRTVTMHLTGKLVAVHAQELVLENAAWIADSGRFADGLKSGDFSEVEPFPDGNVIVGRGSIIDAVSVQHQPRSQK